MKKILFSLLFSFLCLIGFSSFCSAGTSTFNLTIPAGTIEDGKTLFVIPYPVIDYSDCSSIEYSCTFGSFDGSYGSYNYITFAYDGVAKNGSYDYNIVGNWTIKTFYGNSNPNLNTILSPDGGYFSGIFSTSLCSRYFIEGFRFFVHNRFTFNSPLSVSCTLSGSNILNSTCPTCSPQYTSEECQSEYGLVSSGVLNQCNNNLQSCQASLSGRNNTLNNCSNNLLSCESSLASCIQSNCPIDTGSVMWSSIWINGIQHLGKPVINIDIPDQIYRQYTTDDEEFNLYVGSGYDQEYIDNVIAINSYHPTSEDFTSVFVSGLTLIMPYIFIALLILFIRKLVKRIFK